MSGRPCRLLLVALTLALVGNPAIALEEILSYHSEIAVAADASMVVEESITVNAEGNRIRRGIYRDFPTRYEDRLGNNYRVDFEVLGVTRDGSREPYHTEERGNGVRVYVGEASSLLRPGQYTYRIRYRTDRQIGYFESHDELYWNVTGNGWGFPIRQASATVRLPQDVAAQDLTLDGYTGRFGSTARDFTGETFIGGGRFATTLPLARQHGLTIVLGWPKGIVYEPTGFERFIRLLQDNAGLLMNLAALALAAIYLVFIWTRYGRDPTPGVVYARYEPPAGYSPASARYISRMGYDAVTLTSAILNLAVKGYLLIRKDDSSDDYELVKQDSTAALAPGEQALLDTLFQVGDSIVELDDKNHTRLQATREAHRRVLKRDYLKTYFNKNAGLLLPSLLLSAMIAIITFGAYGTSAALLIVVLANALMHGVFAYLLKAPTARGRWLLDQLDGFRLYLDVAEREDLNRANLIASSPEPEKTPELFEKYLPYALALGVEQHWAEQFADVFARIRAEAREDYRPRWYQGNFDTRRVGSFARTVGSDFSSAISSAATPPGSSSGGGGGGSSGGGGGGGGGGGW